MGLALSCLVGKLFSVQLWPFGSWLQRINPDDDHAQEVCAVQYVF
jgi:hypothetical protein